MTSSEKGGPPKGDQKMTGGGGVSAKGDVIYEQKYGGPNQPYEEEVS